MKVKTLRTSTENVYNLPAHVLQQQIMPYLLASDAKKLAKVNNYLNHTISPIMTTNPTMERIVFTCASACTKGHSLLDTIVFMCNDNSIEQEVHYNNASSREGAVVYVDDISNCRRYHKTISIDVATLPLSITSIVLVGAALIGSTLHQILDASITVDIVFGNKMDNKQRRCRKYHNLKCGIKTAIDSAVVIWQIVRDVHGGWYVTSIKDSCLGCTVVRKPVRTAVERIL